MSNKFIYRCSWFESKRHKKSHTDMYFENAKHTEWVFNSCDYLNGLAKVEYIMVGENTKYYEMAVGNSCLRFWEAKQVQLMDEFEKYGNKKVEEEDDDDSKVCITCGYREPMNKFTDFINGVGVMTDECRGCYVEKK